MTRRLRTRISRRRFVAGAALAAAGAVALANTSCDPAVIRRLRQVPGRASLQHRVFVWQFTEDGDAAGIAETLAAANCAIVLKTHDGLDWMAKYDPVPGAIDGPRTFETVAAIFENQGVPVHAWAVVEGVDPAREAAMAADVLAAGARSLVLDLEEHEDFWEGTTDGALRYGEALRAREPYARVDISIDPRPWRLLGGVPLAEFVQFTDGIWPQLYWDDYDDPQHVEAYRYMGYEPPAEGITPEFLIDVAQQTLAPFDRWIIPVGYAAPTSNDDWARFQYAARISGMPEVAAWRYGIMDPEVLRYLTVVPATTPA